VSAVHGGDGGEWVALSEWLCEWGARQSVQYSIIIRVHPLLFGGGGAFLGPVCSCTVDFWASFLPVRYGCVPRACLVGTLQGAKRAEEPNGKKNRGFLDEWGEEKREGWLMGHPPEVKSSTAEQNIDEYIHIHTRSRSVPRNETWLEIRQCEVHIYPSPSGF
jgi:hypothetical protein